MLVSVVGMWWSLSSDGEGCAYKIQRERREYSPIVEETAKTAIDTGRALYHINNQWIIYTAIDAFHLFNQSETEFHGVN
jgi:hypothetical protein